eukprot:362266-Chlamydomonas_euryale.AAC.1
MLFGDLCMHTTHPTPHTYPSPAPRPQNLAARRACLPKTPRRGIDGANSAPTERQLCASCAFGATRMHLADLPTTSMTH